MVYRRKYVKRAARPVGRRVARRRAPIRRRRLGTERGAPLIRNAFSQKEWASHSEVVNVKDLIDSPELFLTNEMYAVQPNMSQFVRASRIAQNYREFRITGFTFRFKPRYDTFMATTDENNATPIPQLYYMIDRAASLPISSTTLANLKQMGARAHRFDDKNIIVKYKPAVVVGLYNDLTSPNPTYTMKRISPWLSTNSRAEGTWFPNNTPHHGIFWYLETAALTGDGSYQYDVELEVNFQFKGPLSAITAPPPA